ncbi:MAG: C69 family dipeptidase [Bacteroidales bacterium]|nr:C69 family dipeptidase [Bacteroidales bacterium]
MKKLSTYLTAVILTLGLMNLGNASAQDKSDWKGGVPEGCTSITVGKKASADGSVMTSHTDDSHRTRSWMDIEQAQDHKDGEMTPMYKRTSTDEHAMPAYKHTKIGQIPEIEHTYQYINTAYPSMNEHQLAIGESTFGGRDTLQSDAGLIDCQRLAMLMLERCTTAREAITMADELTKKYGWRDYGECLTIADPQEVWHFEIVGPGKGEVGAIWAAQCVPDDHIAVNANASTIKEINLDDPDHFMASDNVFDVAEKYGWWNEGEDFRFCYAYAPDSRKSVAARRREWRVFDLLAPSKNFNATSENYPFSVKPDKKVKVQDMIDAFSDYYQGTPYDMRRTLTVENEEGEQVISPLANPFMPYDQLELDNIRGSWFHVDDESGHIRFLGERTIARWYTMYGTITQSRDWLPDEIGGVVWLAQDNIASSIYIPVYSNVTHLPESYSTPGRINGYTPKSAWWAFNRLGTLTAQRWGDMIIDVREVWNPMQTELLEKQKEVEAKALDMYKEKNPKKTIKYLTGYTNDWGNKVVKEALDLGDLLWTKYDEKF